MEEEKAAAYYDELTRKGGGAARFKQGLGFSSATTIDVPPPSRGSSLPSSTSSFMSNFVRESSPTKSKDLDKQSQLQSIQNKLKKKESTSIDAPSSEKIRVRVRDRSRERDRGRERERGSRRSRSRSRSGERRKGRRRRRSRSRSVGSDEERERSRQQRYRLSSGERRRRRRSRSRSSSDGERRCRRERGRSRSRSVSPRNRRSEKGREDGRRERKVVKKEGNVTVDYARLIDGYDNMTPAERVKAKMKLQLAQTAEKDSKMGTGSGRSGWERFEFDKDAPVDEDEIEAADDDVAVVKRINQSFRFTSLEAKREDEIRDAHDEAMFGAPAPVPSHTSESEDEKEDNKHDTDDDPVSNLINEKVLAKQQGSWRDRARRNVG